jgi:orotate phosphoribosyltransferase-like protein
VKKVNKSQKIRELLDKGLSNAQIVKKLKVSQQLVHIVARNHGAKPAVKQTVKVKKSNVSDLIASLKTIIKALERA